MPQLLFIFFLHKTEIYLNKKRIFRLDNLKTPSIIPIFFDQFEYRIENAAVGLDYAAENPAADHDSG